MFKLYFRESISFNLPYNSDLYFFDSQKYVLDFSSKAFSLASKSSLRATSVLEEFALSLCNLTFFLDNFSYSALYSESLSFIIWAYYSI